MSGYIEVGDEAGATQLLQNTNFETYIVAVNYQGSGQDLILGNFTWGYNNSGLNSISGTKINFSPGNCISPIAQQIISNEYPNYKFYGQ